MGVSIILVDIANKPHWLVILQWECHNFNVQGWFWLFRDAQPNKLIALRKTTERNRASQIIREASKGTEKDEEKNF